MAFKRFGLAVALLAVGGCSDGAPAQVAWPDELTVFSGRTPPDYKGRHAFVSILNEGGGEVTVTRVEIASPRFADVTWTGEESFTRAWDLGFDLAHGRCGGDVDTTVSVTYALDGGPERTSRAPVEDRHDSIRSTLDRDCAAATLEAAAEMRVGAGRVMGRGQRSVYVLPLSFAPTGARDDVTFRGIGETVQFRHVKGSVGDRMGTAIPLAGDPVMVEVRLQPSRCNLHVLMEGGRGTYFRVQLQAPELDSDAWFYLPLDNQERGKMARFFSAYCGF